MSWKMSGETLIQRRRAVPAVSRAVSAVPRRIPGWPRVACCVLCEARKERHSALDATRNARYATCALVLGGVLALAARALAGEDPPGCSLANGGAGNTSQGGINFNLTQAHVGDTVQVFPSLGMVANACRAINVTGAVYIATGRLTNFLENVTLDPGVLVSCPTGALCRPGPYNIT